MNKPNKCKNCQWYGKPYWSIINPCDSCPNENNYKTIITIDREPLFKEVLTEEEIKSPISAYGSINIDELNQVIERFKKIPNYDELIKDNNKKDKEIERLNNIIKGIDDIIKNHYIVEHTVQNASIDSILKEIKELKEVIKNE